MKREEFDCIKDAAIEEVLQKHLAERIGSVRKAAMKQLLETALDEIMKSERRVFIERDSENNGNGYYPRTLTAGSWKLDIDVPRGRKGAFRPCPA